MIKRFINWVKRLFGISDKNVPVKNVEPTQDIIIKPVEKPWVEITETNLPTNIKIAETSKNIENESYLDFSDDTVEVIKLSLDDGNICIMPPAPRPKLDDLKTIKGEPKPISNIDKNIVNAKINEDIQAIEIDSKK